MQKSTVFKDANTQEINVRHDINYLLSCFNQLDRNNLGYISRQAAKIFFRSIQTVKYEVQLDAEEEPYQFDQLLSILGKLQFPSQPSIYVLNFVRLLAQFKNQCLCKEQQQSLIQAQQIQLKIKTITKNQIQRQTQRMQNQNKKAYQNMELNQDKQYQIFEKQWNSYIEQFSNQSSNKVRNTINHTDQSLQNQESKFIKTARRYSVMTSPKLLELEQKKKRLVKEGNYNEALALKQKISIEKSRISQQRQNQNSFIATKRFESLKKKKESILATTIMTARNNLQKLLKKKAEDQQIMKIRMKSIREETMKKLKQNVKNEIQKLKSLFYLASKG